MAIIKKQSFNKSYKMATIGLASSKTKSLLSLDGLITTPKKNT